MTFGYFVLAFVALVFAWAVGFLLFEARAARRQASEDEARRLRVTRERCDRAIERLTKENL